MQNPKPGGDQKLLMELHAVASFALLIAVSILMIAVVQQMRWWWHAEEFVDFLRQFAHIYLHSWKLPVLQPRAGSLHRPGSSSELSCSWAEALSDFSVEPVIQSAFRLPISEKGGMEFWPQKGHSLPVHPSCYIIADMMAVCPEVSGSGS